MPYLEDSGQVFSDEHKQHGSDNAIACQRPDIDGLLRPHALVVDQHVRPNCTACGALVRTKCTRMYRNSVEYGAWILSDMLLLSLACKHFEKFVFHNVLSSCHAHDSSKTYPP